MDTRDSLERLLALPALHSSDVAPLVLLLVGLALALFGHRLSRAFCFLLGLLVGVFVVEEVFFSTVQIRHAALPLVVMALVALVVGVASLLTHAFTLCAVLGYILALFAMAVDQGRLLGWGSGRAFFTAFVIASIYLVAGKNWMLSSVLVTASIGSFCAVIGIDHFAGQTVSSILFTPSYFRFLIGAEQAAPECTLACLILVLTWLVLSAVTAFAQLVLVQLEQSALVAERRRLADDALFQTSTSFSYDTFASSRPQDVEQDENPAPDTRSRYNFFGPQHLPENLQPLYPRIVEAFQLLAKEFGFQGSNVANQTEHLLFLLGNYKSRDMPDAISRLHSKLFSNYLEWTAYLGVTPYCVSTHTVQYSPLMYMSPAGAGKLSSSSALRLYEISLWLCIWGEASNLRHMPEFLCLLYHNMGAELSVFRDEKCQSRVGLTAPTRHDGQFLKDVITPVFEVVRNEKGDMETTFRHYDDWNEFFWEKQCLRCYFASPSYHVGVIHDGGESGHRQKSAAPVLPISISEILKHHGKTHLERRSWLHPARAFMRILSFFLTVFHILVCVAYCNYRQWPLLGPDANRWLSSFVISLIGWSITKELVEVWAQYGIITQNATNTAGFLLRLTIKTVAFTYLLAFFVWSYYWSDVYMRAYYLTAFVVLVPYVGQVISQVFPYFISPSWNTYYSPITHTLTQISKFWYPAAYLYVGRDVREPIELTYMYQLFWLVLLLLKFYCSYRFQVMPLIEPTFHIISAKPKWTHIPFYNQVAESTSILVLWIPFVLVYLFDPIIWYFLFQSFVGVWIGMSDRLGEIRDFSAFLSSFTALPWQFEKKLLAWRSKEPLSAQTSPVRLSHNATDSSSFYPIDTSVSSTLSSAEDERAHLLDVDDLEAPLVKDEFRSTAWRNFAVAWNEIVEDLRKSDLISNNEKTMLAFREIKNSKKELYIPLLVTAGSYDNCMEKIGDLAFAHKEANAESAKLIITEQLHTYLNQSIRREGIMEVYECANYLLTNLLGETHEQDMGLITHAIENIVTSRSIPSAIQAQQLLKLKPALLNLVRSLRIAQASFNSHREKEKKKRDLQNEERLASIRAHAQHAKDDRDYAPSDTSDISDDENSPSTTPRFAMQRTTMQSLMKSPSVGTLNILDTIRSTPRYQSGPVVVDDDNQARGVIVLYLNLIRDQIGALLQAISSCVNSSHPDGKIIVDCVQKIMIDNSGFQWNEPYAAKCVQSVLKTKESSKMVTTLHAHLTLAQIDAEPSNGEATRRLLFFANSLFMHLPSAPGVPEMKSLTTLTPFHSEDVLYSFADLEKQTEDGVSVFYYLQTIYPNEWSNFLERCGISDDRVASILHSKKTLEARKWATTRGQTLGRTIDGMMLYEQALRLLCKLEQPTMYDSEIDELVKQKFQYVVSAQVYGKQKREMDPKADEIEFYLHKYPSMRVAYIDSFKSRKYDAHGKHQVIEEHFSVLIKSEGNEIKEVYRIKLPGNPVCGEGKPENQQHAIVFTRGEYLQTIDMNQSNSFEEALKMRNLLEEFKPLGSNDKEVGIVGFREHIYTGGLSSIANYMAMQEGCFVTQGQRVLDRPLRVRMHYGHPDVFDKLFFMSRGGVSKASKGIHLSEDIFAGFNAVLRGSSIVFREYIQVGKGRDVGLQQLFKFEAKLAQGNAMQSISRDVYRLGQTLDFFRLLSFYFGGVGFYISNSLIIWALYFFLYSRMLLAAFGVQEQDTFSGIETLSYWYGMAGFLLTLPVFACFGVEKGFITSGYETLRMLVTGGPLFYMFHMGTKAYYFEQTILAGGAKYRPTGRGFVTRHEDFSEIYRFHASSHFYRAVEMVFLLSFYAIVIPWGFSYVLVTWAGWLIVFSWLFAPFWFNPLAFQYEKFVDDFINFRSWMQRKEGDGDRSWKAWWKDELSFLNDLQFDRRAIVCITSARHAIVGYSLLHYVHVSNDDILLSISLIFLFVFSFMLLQAKFFHRNQFLVRMLKAMVLFLVVFIMHYYQIIETFSFHRAYNLMIVAVGLIYIWSTIAVIALTLGVRHRLLVKYFKMIDWLIGSALLLILGLCSLIVLPGIVQTRLMFYNAFSRGVMINKLLRMQQEPKDSTPHTDPSGSASTKPNGYQTNGDQFGFASMNFIAKRSNSRLRLANMEHENDNISSRKSSHSNGGRNGGNGIHHEPKLESGHVNKPLTGMPAAGSLPGRIPSFSSLSKLAEEDEDTPKSMSANISLAPSHSSTTGTLSVSDKQTHHFSQGAGALPPTVSAESSGGHQQSRSRVSNMTQHFEDLERTNTGKLTSKKQ